MRLQQSQLQESDFETRKIRVKGLNKYKQVDKILYHQKQSLISKIFHKKLISRHNNPLAKYFKIDKIKKLID